MPGMCNCEHAVHFDGNTGHAYQSVPAGVTRAQYVGAICDACVEHMEPWLLPEEVTA